MKRLLTPMTVLLSIVLGIMILCPGCGRNTAPQPKDTAPAHQCSFYNERDFFESVSQDKTDPAEIQIRGGVIPHHLVAGYMIADFFNLLADQEIERVILMGPNHYLKGPRVVSSRYNWLTAFGVLETDTKLVEDFVNQGIAGIDEEAIVKDHAIAGIVPYIKYYLPQARLVPLIFHPDLTYGETENLADLLIRNTGEKDVIVASVDFSHYLRLGDAEQRDVVTIQAIEQRDYARLLKMTDEYLDSPPSIVALLMAMERLGADDMTVVHHSNSALVLGRNEEETTSYFTIVYY